MFLHRVVTREDEPKDRMLLLLLLSQGRKKQQQEEVQPHHPPPGQELVEHPTSPKMKECRVVGVVVRNGLDVTRRLSRRREKEVVVVATVSKK